MLKIGSKWSGGEGRTFRVISVTEIDGKTWVFYRAENSDSEPREFSCFQESFLSRFTPMVNE